MMYKRCLILLLMIQSLLLAGCSQTAWIRDRGQDYKTAKALPSLKIPSDMRTEAFSDTYAISMPDESLETQRQT